MARVTTHTANRGAKKPRYCTGCRQEITAGQRYYYWSRRFGRSGMEYYKHVECGRPRPTELSSRKTAVVEEAIQAAADEMQNWRPEFDATPDDAGSTYDLDYSDLSAALESVADEAEGVADEYEEGVQNMPEGLQYGPTGEAMQAVADELREWAEELRSWQPDAGTVEVPEKDAADSRAEWEELAQSAHDMAVDDLRSEAESAMEDLPEYQG